MLERREPFFGNAVSGGFTRWQREQAEQAVMQLVRQSNMADPRNSPPFQGVARQQAIAQMLARGGIPAVPPANVVNEFLEESGLLPHCLLVSQRRNL